MNTQIKQPANEAAPKTTALDNNKSLVSKCTLNDVGLLLEQSDPMEGKLTIENIMEKDDGLDPLDGLVYPLADFDDDDMMIPEASSEWQGDELPETPVLATIVSQDSSSVGETGGDLVEDDISLLMTGDLLEPDIPQPVVDRGAEMTAQVDVIGRIMACIHHTESDRRVVYQAEAIVHECHVNHHRGDRRFKNLSGSIFERFIAVFGGPKFNEIYHRSQDYSPPHLFARQMTADPSVPTMLELAIAYGLHMARTTDGSEDRVEQLVRHGAESLKSMSDAERCMFWDYMTKSEKA